MFKLILTFILTVLILGQSNRVASWFAGEEYIAVNHKVEGARIFQLRHKYLVGEFPKADLYFVGSSRNMSLYSPSALAEAHSKRCDGEQITIKNLGESGKYPLNFDKTLAELKDGSTVVLEYSPLIFSGVALNSKK